MSRVILYGRDGCHLCDTARDVVTRVCAELDVAWTEVDIDDDPVAAYDYAEEIPVVLVDGSRHAMFRVDPDRLRAALQGS